MIRLRFKKNRKNYSLYLDYNCNHTFLDENGKVVTKRKVEFLKLYSEFDYSKRKHIESVDKETLEVAKAILKKRELALLTNDRELLPKQDNASFLDFFKNQLEIKNHRTYDAVFAHLSKFTNNKLRFKDVDTGFLMRFTDYLKDIVHQNSVIHYLKRVQIIWNLALKRDIVRHNPFLSLDKPQKISSEKIFLDLSEIQKLSDSKTKIKPVIKKAFLFSCFTGLRYSDIKKLEWANIKDDVIHYQQTKTKKFEQLPLSKQAKSILETIEKKDALIFAGLPKSDIVNKKLRQWSKDSNIDKPLLHFHSARHSYAILCLQNGIEIYTISKLLGHSDIKTTQVYAQIVDKMKAEAVDKLPTLL